MLGAYRRCALLTGGIARAVPHGATSRGLSSRARNVERRQREVVALGRLTRTNASPFRVVFHHSNRNVKAAIIDDRRDLTVRPPAPLPPSLPPARPAKQTRACLYHRFVVQVVSASTLEPWLVGMLDRRHMQDMARVATVDCAATVDYRLQHIAADSALFADSSRYRSTADKSAVSLVASVLAHRALEAGVEEVRMPVRRSGRGNVVWFRQVLTDHGLRVVHPRKKDAKNWARKGEGSDDN
eukprot:COSAG01_NODE_4178_length_5265_cov_17.430649_7_plen_241_part_00